MLTFWTFDVINGEEEGDLIGTKTNFQRNGSNGRQKAAKFAALC